MNFQWQGNGVVLGDLDEFLWELIRKLPACATVEDEPVRKRLFGSPTAGADPVADEEWTEVVEPELRELFESHVNVVSEDLNRMEEIDGEHTVRVPQEHLHAWIHTLNQARLALGARHDITEDDMEGRRLLEDENKGYAMLQIEIYGAILGILLHHFDL
jgi:hypothetical protein